MNIAELAGKAFDAAERFRMLGLQNTATLDYNERKNASIAYAVAEAEMIEARKALDKATGKSP